MFRLLLPSHTAQFSEPEKIQNTLHNIWPIFLTSFHLATLSPVLKKLIFSLNLPNGQFWNQFLHMGFHVSGNNINQNNNNESTA